VLNKGNILELLDLVSKYNPEIKGENERKNGKQLHHAIQNEILEIAAPLLAKSIKADLHYEPDTYCAILAGECKDLPKRDLVLVAYVSDTCTTAH